MVQGNRPGPAMVAELDTSLGSVPTLLPSHAQLINLTGYLRLSIKYLLEIFFRCRHY